MTRVIARLIVFRDAQRLVEHQLTEDQLSQGFTIGAEASNTLKLVADVVSRRHAEIRRRLGQIQITCLSATNSLLVGAHKLGHNERATLTGPTEIVIVPFRLLFELVDQQPDALANPASASPANPVPAPTPSVAPSMSSAPPPPAGPAPAFAPSAGPAPAAPAAFPSRNLTLPQPAPTPIVPGPIRVVSWPIAIDQPGRYLRDLPAIFADPPLVDVADAEVGAALQSLTSTRIEEMVRDDPDQGGFLDRYLKIFEAIWEPWEQRQTHLEQYVDPQICPEDLLDLLARWLGITSYPGMTVAQRRRLIATAGEAIPLLGTHQGLRMVIKACTDLDVTVSDLPNQSYIFHVALPPEGAPLRSLVEQIIQAHKPAYMGYILE